MGCTKISNYIYVISTSTHFIIIIIIIIAHTIVMYCYRTDMNENEYYSHPYLFNNCQHEYGSLYWWFTNVICNAYNGINYVAIIIWHHDLSLTLKAVVWTEPRRPCLLPCFSNVFTIKLFLEAKRCMCVCVYIRGMVHLWHINPQHHEACNTCPHS